jgi:DNA-binding transcriptional MerR regulator
MSQKPSSPQGQSLPTGLLRIGAVVQRTGLSSHVIRVWERRYGAVVPHRSAGGTRMYDGGHVRRLQALSRLTEHGYAISAVASLNDGHLRELEGELQAELPHGRRAAIVEPISDDVGRIRPARSCEAIVDEFLGAIGEFDLDAGASILSRALQDLPPGTFVRQIASPAVVRAGQRWALGTWSMAHEHALYSAMRTALGALLSAQRTEPGASVVVITALTAGLHEFGALMTAIEAARLGWKTVYLGPHLSSDEIAHTVTTCGASVLALSVVAEPSTESARTLESLRSVLPRDVEILLSGRAASMFQGTLGITVNTCIEDFELALVRLHARAAS